MHCPLDGSFAIFCWNVHCLPFPLTRQDRIDRVVAHVESHALGAHRVKAMALCEVWDRTARKALASALEERGWRHTSAPRAGLLLAWDGACLVQVNVRGRPAPAAGPTTVAFRHCRLADCLASKGVFAARLRPSTDPSESGSVSCCFWLAATHLQSGRWSSVRAAQLSHALGVLSSISDRCPGSGVVLVGDFNMEPGDAERLLREDKGTDGTWSVCPDPAQGRAGPTVEAPGVEGETLDFAIVRGEIATRILDRGAHRVLVPRNGEGGGCPSDHYPVIITVADARESPRTIGSPTFY